MNGRRLVLPALFLTVLQGCETSARAPQPVVTDSAGVEIATLERMPSLLDPDYEWGLHVEREFRTQGAALDSEPLLFDPSTVLPLRDGRRLLVSDPFADQPLILVDVDTGEVLERFAGKGQGPGELSGYRSMGESEDGRLWVLSVGPPSQILWYSRDGELLSTQAFVLDGWPLTQMVQPRTGKLYSEIFTPPANRLDRMDVVSGEQLMVLDLPTLGDHQRPGDIRAGRALWTVLRSGLVTTRSDVPVFFFYSDSGDLKREIRLPLSMRTITQMDVRLQIERDGEATGPGVGPFAITNGLFAVDDSIFGMYQSRVWRAAEDPAPPEDQTIWRLISVTGEYMGFLRLPDGFRLLAGGSEGVLWARVLDENAVPVIQELALERPAVLAR